MRASLPEIQPSAAAVVVALCDQSEKEVADYLSGEDVEQQSAETSAALEQAVGRLVGEPILTLSDLRALGAALVKYLDLVGSEEHDQLVKEGLRRVSRFMESDSS